MRDLIVATRGSPLAMAQAAWVIERLRTANRHLETSLLPISTFGDEDGATPVSALTEMGAFVRAVQRAVLDGRAHVAVHSCKDLPTAGPDDLVAAYPEREAPWDVLCGASLTELGDGARVGTGSPRRAAQLRRLRPGVSVEEIRGNVGTRLAKVGRGDLDAVVLAEAGLRRLGVDDAIRHRFSLDEMVPAPAQAALAVEAAAGSQAEDIIGVIDDPATRVAVETERSLLAATGAGCRAALGALATVDGAGISMTAFVEDGSGPRRATVFGESTPVVVQRMREALSL